MHFVFPSVLSIVFALSVFILWILSERPVYKQNTDNTKKTDGGSYQLISIGVFSGIAFALVLLTMNLFGNDFGMFSDDYRWMSYVGSFVALCGIAFRKHSQRTLGKFFTGEVRLHDDHQLIQIGPYKVFRHPSYFGSTVTLFGFGLMLNNFISALVFLVISISIYVYRTRIEEMAMINQFGNQYKEYKNKTWGFLPFIK